MPDFIDVGGRARVQAMRQVPLRECSLRVRAGPSAEEVGTHCHAPSDTRSHVSTGPGRWRKSGWQDGTTTSVH